MTKNCHKVVRKYLTRNVKFMNIIPGCNTKVEGQKVVNKNWLMLCKWPEEASVRVWPNMSLQRAQAGMFVFPVFKCEFSSMNTAKYSWHKQQKLLTNIHMSCGAHSRHFKLECHVTFVHKACTFRISNFLFVSNCLAPSLSDQYQYLWQGWTPQCQHYHV